MDAVETGTMRERQVGAVAGCIADAGMSAAEAEATNVDGWTVEIGNGRDDGGWLRCEGVVLNTTELRQAIGLAASW